MDFDLSMLFNFQNSYEVLKRVIEAMAKMQKSNERRISDLEDNLFTKSREIELLKSVMPSGRLDTKMRVTMEKKNRKDKGLRDGDDDKDQESARHKYDDDGKRIMGHADDNSMIDDIMGGMHGGNESQISKKSSVYMNQTQKDMETQDTINKLNRRVMKLEKEIIEINKN